MYQFLDKKRTEGKNYYVYMTAACNKFLRIYYARVKGFMESLETKTKGVSTPKTTANVSETEETVKRIIIAPIENNSIVFTCKQDIAISIENGLKRRV